MSSILLINSFSLIHNEDLLWKKVDYIVYQGKECVPNTRLIYRQQTPNQPNQQTNGSI